jgi:hypothetical protein
MESGLILGVIILLCYLAILSEVARQLSRPCPKGEVEPHRFNKLFERLHSLKETHYLPFLHYQDDRTSLLENARKRVKEKSFFRDQGCSNKN